MTRTFFLFPLKVRVIFFALVPTFLDDLTRKRLLCRLYRELTVLLGIVGGVVLPSSPNPEPNQNAFFYTHF